MTDLLFPSGIIIIFFGAVILFLLGVSAGYGMRHMGGKKMALAFCLLSGIVLSYLYYVSVIDLVFR